MQAELSQPASRTSDQDGRDEEAERHESTRPRSTLVVARLAMLQTTHGVQAPGSRGTIALTPFAVRTPSPRSRPAVPDGTRRPRHRINEFNSPFRIPHSAFFVRRGSPDPAIRLNAWGVRHAVDRMRALRSTLFAGIALVREGETAFRAEPVPFGIGAFGLERRMRKRRPANFLERRLSPPESASRLAFQTGQTGWSRPPRT